MYQWNKFIGEEFEEENNTQNLTCHFSRDNIIFLYHVRLHKKQSE